MFKFSKPKSKGDKNQGGHLSQSRASDTNEKRSISQHDNVHHNDKKKALNLKLQVDQNNATLFEAKWPLTHEERIAELERYYHDPRLHSQQVNILAAINYHRQYPSTSLCSRKATTFSGGRVIPHLDDWDGKSPLWREGIMLMHAYNVVLL